MNKTIMNWLDKLFREEILKLEDKKEVVVLDVGAGIVKYINFRDIFQEVVGIDPDERVVENPYLHKGYIGLADSMPFFEDRKFDLIISDNVFKHVDNPEVLFNEISRVLKHGGNSYGKNTK